jgi:hypothetical protein
LKTKIITLESHDDLISVRDKLSWAKTPRILLVWPQYEKVTLRLLDLKVLQRHADSLGAQLGLVTRRMKVRRDAESLGIPVFRSTPEAQRKEWKQSTPREQFIPKPPRRDLRELRDIAYPKESAWRTSLPGRIITFTFAVAAVLAIAILFIPHASVTVYPEIKAQSVTIPINASEANAAVSITGAIPARKISVTVSAEQTLAITHTITVPKSKAQGLVRFSNLSQGETVIPKGTIVSTTDDPPARFVTLTDTLFGAQNKFVDVKIEALDPGSKGNVAADKIKAIEGLLGFSLTVTNQNPTSGGSDTQEIGATDDDRTKLREATLENLRRDAEAKLRAQVAADDILALDTIEVVNITGETFTPEANQPGSTLTLKMQAEYSARTIANDDLNQLALAALDSSVPGGFAIIGPASLKVRGEPQTDSAGVTRFEIEVSRPMIRTVDRMRIFSVVRGNESAVVKDQLTKQLALRQPPEIIITPSWWKWMPLIPLNVSVEVK